MLEPSPAAYRAEGGRVEHRIGGTDEPLAIRYGSALHEIGEAGPGVHRRRDFPRVLTLEKEGVADDARVVRGVQVLIR